MEKVELDFGKFVCRAEFFETEIAFRFVEHLPYEIKLTGWGEELYGNIGVDLGEESPVPMIPPGGLAYTRQGNYFCIFFGQTPAWPVEHIGYIIDGDWERLSDSPGLDSVIVRLRQN